LSREVPTALVVVVVVVVVVVPFLLLNVFDKQLAPPRVAL
jgi:signal transduction histidine kinase